MGSILVHLYKGKHRKIFLPLLLVLIISVAVSVYSLSGPAITITQINDDIPRIETNYDYKATLMPNVLYPNGGTVEAGDTMFRKITTAIPINLKSTIDYENEILAKGTHEAKLVIKAGDMWERMFPLEKKQAFEEKGKAIAILEKAYKIDLEKVNAFILQVEEETGIKLPQYAIEVVPNIQGTINYDGKEMNIQEQGKLTFQYSYEEIALASEKVFTSMSPLATTEMIPNTFNLFGFSLPLSRVRIISSLFSLSLLLTIIYVYKRLVTNHAKPITSRVEKINKKYSSRIIPVSEKLNIDQKSILTLDSFKSVLKIADDKELPIFFHNDHQDGSAIYFIVDGDYLYSYVTSITDLIPRTSKRIRKAKTYAIG
ncbi:DUF5305 family protein [Sporosarcina sp. FSL K6-1508]|uniref:DUF5305 family protein n=1 Tax=Sporosarcina sp. FSL K6-1508 TaxID=2921553 RepID=UPI0030FA6EFC